MIPSIQETTGKNIPEPAMSLHLMEMMRMASLATANSSLASNSMDSSNTASPDMLEARI